MFGLNFLLKIAHKKPNNLEVFAIKLQNFRDWGFTAFQAHLVRSLKFWDFWTKLS